ncbi:uncharacterized protein LOC141899148 [Tubulanus polymorphus]|uniref:uncharacterized protein LOC141899148 n=1 Tax=Tubulanus polymorphus TaxID=672921 RepID=UPI003DA611AC
MSGMYYKVIPKAKAVKMYGYQKASPEKIEMINQRMLKPTNASMYGLVEYKGDGQFRKRPHTACVCSRAPDDAVMTPNNKVYVDERTLNRIIRRLRTPTFCSQIGNADKDTDEMETDLQKFVRTKPISDAEEKKRLKRLMRPTTATNQKKVGCCYICEDSRNSDIMKECFCDDKVVPEAELEEIVWRMQKTTNASKGGKDMCRKAPEATKITIAYDRLPLMSGLPRTRKVNDIVNRLYKPKSNGDYYYRTGHAKQQHRSRSAQARMC